MIRDVNPSVNRIQPCGTSIDQSIKTRDAERRWDTPTDAPAVTAAHRRMSSVTRRNDGTSANSALESMD